MKRIELTQGQYALVDDSDFEWLSQFKWYADWLKSTGTFYAKRKIPGGKKQTTQQMSRLILNAPAGTFVDHKNRDTLDNRRENLRLVSVTENLRNRKKPKSNTSGYKGVILNKRNGKWQARIKVNGKYKYLGNYTDINEAAKAYEVAAKEIFGEHYSSF